MLCIAWHPVTHQFPYENRMGLQWQLTCIQMFSLTHKHVFKLSRPTHGLQTSEPNRRGSFLNITIISLYCNARTDWLSPGETNTDPRVIQEVGSRRGDAIFARSANIHTRTCTHTHTHSSTLWDETHSECSFANRYASSNLRLFCLIWLTTATQRLSSDPTVN